MKVSSFSPPGAYIDAWTGFLNNAEQCLQTDYDLIIVDVMQNGGGCDSVCMYLCGLWCVVCVLYVHLLCSLCACVELFVYVSVCVATCVWVSGCWNCWSKSISTITHRFQQTQTWICTHRKTDRERQRERARAYTWRQKRHDMSARGGTYRTRHVYAQRYI